MKSNNNIEEKQKCGFINWSQGSWILSFLVQHDHVLEFQKTRMVLANRNSPLASRPCRRLLAFTVAWTCLCFVFFRVYYAQHMDNVVQVWKFDLWIFKINKTSWNQMKQNFHEKYVLTIFHKSKNLTFRNLWKIYTKKYSVKLINFILAWTF